MLGPQVLSPMHRHILKRAINRSDLIKFRQGKLEWKSKEFKTAREYLRKSLRLQQAGRCIYCRRVILLERKNSLEDIEHFLDKSKAHYRRWTFSPVNLAIACRPCNFVKSTRDLGDASAQTSFQYSATMGTFTWIHPYYDNYHDNIEINKGWIYQVKATAPNPSGAFAMIQDLQLAELQSMHAYASEIKDKIYRLTILAQRCIQKNPARAIKLLDLSVTLQKDAWPDY